MVDRAGHWAHEEQAEQVSELLIRFLREARHVPAVRLGTSLSGGDRHLNSAGCRHVDDFRDVAYGSSEVRFGNFTP